MTDLGIKKNGDTVTVHLPAQMVETIKINEYYEQLTTALKSSDSKQIVLVFTDVTFFNSEQIGGLVRLTRVVRDEGGEIRLCSMQHGISDVLKACNLIPKMFEYYDTEEAAVASYGSPPPE